MGRQGITRLAGADDKQGFIERIHVVDRPHGRPMVLYERAHRLAEPKPSGVDGVTPAAVADAVIEPPAERRLILEYAMAKFGHMGVLPAPSGNVVAINQRKSGNRPVQRQGGAVGAAFLLGGGGIVAPFASRPAFQHGAHEQRALAPGSGEHGSQLVAVDQAC